MSITFNLKSGSCSSQSSSCLSKEGCPVGICPDFTIRRHDTRPSFRVQVEDCDGPLDLQGLVIEASMWALARLKTAITVDDTYFRLADDIGFNQVMIGDIIIVDRIRSPEHMLVTGFDEENNFIRVQRAYHGTNASACKKGTMIRIFRIMGAPADSEISFQDVQEVDGTTTKDVLQGAYLVYEWQAEDVCLPGCYWFEFKVMKMIDVVWYLPGGYWTGDVFTNDNGFFYTGLALTNSSVRLSYNQIEDKYFIPSTSWAGDLHLHSDNSFYTGIAHDEGSVILSKTGIPSDDDTPYNEDGIVALSISVIPSFTDISLTPTDYGCILGEGVEFVRRFPVEGEGFLVKITNSPTMEL
jgi:hypothetical protein